METNPTKPTQDAQAAVLRDALEKIESQAVCGAIAVDFDEALEMLARCAKLAHDALEVPAPENPAHTAAALAKDLGKMLGGVA